MPSGDKDSAATTPGVAVRAGLAPSAGVGLVRRTAMAEAEVVLQQLRPPLRRTRDLGDGIGTQVTPGAIVDVGLGEAARGGTRAASRSPWPKGHRGPSVSRYAFLEEAGFANQPPLHILLMFLGFFLGALVLYCVYMINTCYPKIAGSGDAHPFSLCGSLSTWLIMLLCAVSAVEGADLALLPASMFALQRDFGFGPGHLATMSLWQAIFQAVAAPAWGVLADRRIFQRRSILAMGCAGWGVATLLLASVDSFVPMVFLRSVNGVMLASLRPISNGLVPDFVEATGRGNVYGYIQLSMNLGNMVCALVVTPIAGVALAGGLVHGWRLAFVAVGFLSLALAVGVILTMWEPPFGKAGEVDEAEDVEGPDSNADTNKPSWRQALWEEALRLRSYLQTPTFGLIVFQGLFGMIPWNALGYLTFFLQTAGLSGSQAAFITAFGTAAQAVGALLGGVIGDFAAKRLPDHGRPFVAQVSVVAGIPLIWLLFLGVNPGPDHFMWYCIVYGLLGLVATWCGAGVNWPIFTEIVPAEGRSAVVAWDTSFEGISGAVFGNLAVSFLAERCFGYRLGDGSAGDDTTESAMALGQALAWTTTGPFVLCLLVYSAMHWTYPKDRRRCSLLEPPSIRRRRAPPP